VSQDHSTLDMPDTYLATVKRLEPDINILDSDATLTSIAISLKRIADVLEAWKIRDDYK
jgi:methanogenic corrinoid protein MtbC1